MHGLITIPMVESHDLHDNVSQIIDESFGFKKEQPLIPCLRNFTPSFLNMLHFGIIIAQKYFWNLFVCLIKKLFLKYRAYM